MGAAPRDDVRLVDEMELEHHAEVGEGIETGDDVGCKAIRSKTDDRFHRPPLVVVERGTTADDDADGLQGDHEDPS